MSGKRSLRFVCGMGLQKSQKFERLFMNSAARGWLMVIRISWMLKEWLSFLEKKLSALHSNRVLVAHPLSANGIQSDKETWLNNDFYSCDLSRSSFSRIPTAGGIDSMLSRPEAHTSWCEWRRDQYVRLLQWKDILLETRLTMVRRKKSSIHLWVSPSQIEYNALPCFDYIAILMVDRTCCCIVVFIGNIMNIN